MWRTRFKSLRTCIKFVRRLHSAIDALLLVTEPSRTSLMSLAFTLRLCLMMMFKKVIVIMMVMMMVMMMMIMSVPGVPSLLAFKI